MNPPTAEAASDPNGYDAVPYKSQAFAQTHPDRLATIAHIFGLVPPEVSRCRVLELGCAAGGNLIPMAYALPGGEFVGVDLSAGQAAEGQRAIRALGLGNARIEHASIMDIDESWGQFDYLICHGVFSWVPPEVRDKILEIASRQLSGQGVAYISYNTYPGWHLRGSVRHMLGYHTAPIADPGQRVAKARTLLDQLAAAVAPDDGAYGRMLGGELERLRASEDWYLYHEVLEPNNTPMYFHEFIERAQGVGLQYLGEAELSSMLGSKLPPRASRTLREMSADLVRFEQNLDFVGNRHFRQTLLCKGGLDLRRGLSADSIAGLYAACGARPEGGGGIDPRPGVTVTFRGPDGTQGGTSNPLTKSALALLGERWPLGWRMDALADAAWARAADWVNAADARPARQLLMQDLLQCFLSGLVELRTWQPPCVDRVGARPKASAWAAAEAAAGPQVTNLRHEVINLLPISRHLLSLLDGQRGRTELLDDLHQRVAQGSLALPQTDRPPNAEALRASLAAWLDDSLARLARHSLLIG